MCTFHRSQQWIYVRIPSVHFLCYYSSCRHIFDLSSLIFHALHSTSSQPEIFIPLSLSLFLSLVIWFYKVCINWKFPRKVFNKIRSYRIAMSPCNRKQLTAFPKYIIHTYEFGWVRVSIQSGHSSTLYFTALEASKWSGWKGLLKVGKSKWGVNPMTLPPFLYPLLVCMLSVPPCTYVCGIEDKAAEYHQKKKELHNKRPAHTHTHNEYELRQTKEK